jgi:hypothetical protein
MHFPIFHKDIPGEKQTLGILWQAKICFTMKCLRQIQDNNSCSSASFPMEIFNLYSSSVPLSKQLRKMRVAEPHHSL